MKLCWKSFLTASALAGVLLVSGNAQAAKHVLVSGGDIDGAVEADLIARGYTPTSVSPGSFAATSFAGYDAIWLGWSTYFPGLASRQTDLINFVNGGGNLFAETAFGNPIGDYPYGSELTTTGNQGNGVHIADPADPVNAGLTDAGLSNWSESYHNTFSALGSFNGATTATDSYDNGQWVTIDKCVGLGSIIYTGQDADYHIQYGAGATGSFSPKGDFINNALSDPSCVPEPCSMALLLTGGGPMLLTLRRRSRKQA